MSDLETEYWLDDISDGERQKACLIIVDGTKPKTKKVKKQARRR